MTAAPDDRDLVRVQSDSAELEGPKGQAVTAVTVLIPLASVEGARAGFSVALYCLTICGLFGISALYHRRRWSPRGWKIMKRLDHSMIFLLIAGVASLVLLATGGVLYTLGGVAYGIKKPNPWPGVFGYHEVFHAMTIVAAICHYIAVYFAMYNSPFV